ncbi:MAG: Ig-like domain-containing protein, partial [Propionibacteriaceae bacterium]|nr:Ig-like domain-containing protein [Propionibacteriaceae bacterium]
MSNPHTRTIAITAALALFLTGQVALGTPSAYAEGEGSYDITAGINRLGTDSGRDFGTARTFTRIEVTSTTQQELAFELYDWDAEAWQQFGSEEVSGSESVVFDEPVVASKIRVTPTTGVKITGVYNDSPLVSADPLHITTTTGVPPVLPLQVNVNQANGGRVLVPVTWNNPYPSAYWDTPREGVTITGDYGSGDDAGTVTMTVDATAERGLKDVPTPYMGWNTWYTMSRAITEEGVRTAVAGLEAKGLFQKGYDIVWLDEGWWQAYDPTTAHGTARTYPEPYRDDEGNIVISERFSGDIKVLADWLHARGLKIGLYADPDQQACGDGYGNGGQNWFEFFRNDIAKYVEWGIDAIKMDHCGSSAVANRNFPSITNAELYASFYQALRDADPEGTIIYDTCEWGDESSGDWAYKIAHGYRTGADLSAPSPGDKYWYYWERNLNRNGSRPGAYPDPDYLVINQSSTSNDPEWWRTQVSMWAMAASPLIVSAPPALLTDKHIEILMNDDILAIDQDPDVIQPVKIREDATGLQVWSRPLADKDGKQRVAVMLLNKTSTAANIGFDWSDTGLTGVTSVKNVWEDVYETPGASYSGVVFTNEVTILIAEGTGTAITSGYALYNYAPHGFTSSSSTAKSTYENAGAYRSQSVVDGYIATSCSTSSNSFTNNPTPSCWWQPHSLKASEPAWVAIDLGQTRTVEEVVLVMKQAYASEAKIQYLVGDVWTDAVTLPSLDSGTTSIPISSVTTTAVRLATADGVGLQVNEFEVYGPDKVNSGYTSLGSSVTTGTRINYALASTGNTTATAKHQHSSGSYPPAALIDGTLYTGTDNSPGGVGNGRWHAANASFPVWAMVTFTTPESRGSTVQINFGKWYHRLGTADVYYCPPENAPCDADTAEDWIKLATIAYTPTGDQLQAAENVDVDVDGLTLQAVMIVFTSGQTATSALGLVGNSAVPCFYELLLLSPVDPVVTRTVNVTTRAGKAPVLPARVMARYAEGNWGSREVTWDPPNPSDYATPGVYTATGVVSNTTVAATARVTVLPRPATLTELQALVDANANRVEADYTVNTWAPFATALADAQAALTSSPTQAQIEAVGGALEDAVDDLTNVKALRVLVAEKELLNAADFTSGWADFAAALSDAQGVLANPAATQAEVDEAVVALQDAADDLLVPNMALDPQSTATASSSWRLAGYGPQHVIDGDTTTTYDDTTLGTESGRWNSGLGDESGAWVALEWPAEQTANYVRIYFKEWWGRVGLAHLQYEVDGEWVTLASIAVDPDEGQYLAQEIVNIPLDTLEFTKLRLIYEKAVTNGTGANPSVYEIEVYNWPVIKAFEATAETVVEQAPRMPETVLTLLSTGDSVYSPVVWDPISASDYAALGTFTVTGTVVGSTVTVTATVTVVPTGDTTALADLLAGAQALLDSGTLTAASAAALAGPVADAAALVADNSAASQTDVDAVFDALLAAVGQAEVDTSRVGSPVNVDILEALVTLVEAVPTDRYTDASVAVLVEKLEAAQAVLADSGRTQAEVEAAIAGVQDAVAGLRNHYVTQLVTNVTALNLVKKKTFQ